MNLDKKTKTKIFDGIEYKVGDIVNIYIGGINKGKGEINSFRTGFYSDIIRVKKPTKRINGWRYVDYHYSFLKQGD